MKVVPLKSLSKDSIRKYIFICKIFVFGRKRFHRKLKENLCIKYSVAKLKSLLEKLDR